MTMDPKTAQEFLALELATKHAEAFLQYPAVITWACATGRSS